MALVDKHLIAPWPSSNCRPPIKSAKRLFATQSGLLLRKMYKKALAGGVFAPRLAQGG